MSAAPLWTPPPERAARSRLVRFLDAHGFRGERAYDDAWAWSVDAATTGEFWASIADAAGVAWHRPPLAWVEPDPGRVPGVRWCRDATLNYAERMLTPPPGGPEVLAVVARSDTRPPVELTWGELTTLVARVRAALAEAGVAAGDRVAGYLPNVPEALAAMLATASLGAVWCCTAPEMGVTGVLDRLSQVDPTVLIAVDGYRFGDRSIDRSAEAVAVRAALPSLREAVWVAYLHPDRPPPQGWTAWDEMVAKGAAVRTAPHEFTPVDFDHPLYVLFTSGTTGKPKPIVHCHGGILLEHAKVLGLHFDLGPGDRFFWFTTTGWMMWNFCVSGLLVGATVVLFDGAPAGPAARPGAAGMGLFELMADTRTTCGGVGAAYLVACAKAGLEPGRAFDLSGLTTLGSTGSPLPAAAAEWVYRACATDVLLGSFSGGTDVCTGFVGGSPLHPVWAGEISCRCLGARVEVYDDVGRPVVDREGELVISAPLPSMPVGLWGDDGSRYRDTYFGRFPGVWAHGDRATLTDRGTVVISGRSDGTLNRGGVRLGTAELYAVVEGHDAVTDSLAVHVEDLDGGPGTLWLFVVTSDPGEPLAERLRAALRRDLSARHVPDRVVFVPSIPRTLSGKKLEVPVKRLLAGVPLDDALSTSAVADPDSLGPFLALAPDGRPAGTSRSSEGAVGGALGA